MKTVSGINQRVLRALIAQLFACFITVSTAAYAQDYPSRLIRLIVPASPGGGTDISARLIAPKLSEYLGQQVIVDNRPGATTTIGGEFVARAAPDGYTLLLGVGSLAIVPHILKDLRYDPTTAFAPVSLVAVVPNIIVSHPSLPVRTVKELIAFARKRPGQLNVAAGGTASSAHLAIELFLSMSGLKIVYVPYNGQGPAMIAVVSGEVHLMMATLLSALPHVKNGRVRALGVTGPKRVAIAPEIPTIAEAGVPGYEVLQWYGLLVPAKTPRAIIDKLHAVTVRALQDPQIKQLFINEGGEPVGNTPEEFAAIIQADYKKWGKVIKDAGIKLK